MPVLSAMFSRNSKRIISSHVDGTLRIWDIGHRKQIKRLSLGKELTFIQHSADGKSILAAHKGDNPQVKLFEENTSKTLFRYYDEDANYIENLSLSADGKYFATSDVSGHVLLWAINKHKPIHKLDIGFSGSDTLAFSPDGKTLAVGGRNQNLFLFDTASGNKLWQLIPSYQPSELETHLTKEKEQRQAKLNEVKLLLDKQAAIDTKIYKKKVYLTLDHYGDVVDSRQLRMLESDVPKKSKVKKTVAEASAIWLRLHNDSPFPIQVPTQSMYLPNCSYQFSSGKKISGLCDNREISIWFEGRCF